MVDALLGAHVADVHQTLDAFSNLNECSKFGEIRDRPFNDGSYRQTLCHVSPGIAQGLLQSERDPTLRRIHSEDDCIHGLAGLHDIAGNANFLPP